MIRYDRNKNMKMKNYVANQTHSNKYCAMIRSLVHRRTCIWPIREKDGSGSFMIIRNKSKLSNTIAVKLIAVRNVELNNMIIIPFQLISYTI